jgi:hypothetical protein
VADGLAVADADALALGEALALADALALGDADAAGVALPEAGVVGLVEALVGVISGEVMAVNAKSAPPMSRAKTITVATTTAVMRRSSDQFGQMTLRSSSRTPRR